MHSYKKYCMCTSVSVHHYQPEYHIQSKILINQTLKKHRNYP